MGTSGEARRPVTGPRVLQWRPDPVRVVDVSQSAKTVLAGVLAWVMATEVLGLQQAFLAPWAAVLVVHATVYRTVSSAGRQVAGTFIGVFLAWAAAQLLDPSWLAMAALLSVSFVVGQLRWMRDEGTNIATTGIVVLATNAVAQSNLLTSRLVDTTTGVVVGLGVNLLVWPPLQDRAAWSRVQALPHELAAVLHDLAEGLGPDVEDAAVDGWVSSCRRIDVHVDEAWQLLTQARESGRLNPRRSQPAGLDDLVVVLHRLEQAIADTLSMVRTVAVSVETSNVWQDDFRDDWRRLLSATADGTDAGDPDLIREVLDEIADLIAALPTWSIDRSAWHEYGGTLVNLRNVAAALEDVARWSSESGPTPTRTTRYAVPHPELSVERLRPPGLWGRRLTSRRGGYVGQDEPTDP